MKIRFLTTLILFAFLISCTSNEDLTIDTDSTLLTIELDQNFLNDNDSFFYLIQNATGETLPSGFGSLANGDILIFEGSSGIEALNVSLLNYSALQNRVEAKTYLNIPAENTISLNSIDFSSNAPVQVQFTNRPGQLEEFNFSANNRFTPGSLSILPPDESIPFGIGGYDQLETTFVTVNDLSSSIPKYQVLNLSNDILNVVDYNDNVEMEVSHDITSSISNTQLNISLKGYKTSDFQNPNGNHVLYRTFSPSIVQNTFTIYSMNSFFSDYQLTISAEQDNFIYQQITNGSIPLAFSLIDPEITINQSSFFNYEIVAENSFSTTNSYWNLKDENGISDLVRWNIYSNSDQTSFLNLDNLPSDLPSELEILNSLEELNLNSVKAIDVPGQDYLSLMSVLFAGSNFDLLPEVYSKTLPVQ